MRNLIKILVLFLIATHTLVACAGYNAELHKVTRVAKKYNFKNADPYIIWRATFFTQQFRRAYTKRHIDLERMSPLEAARWIAEQEKRQSEVWEFFVSIYNPPEYADFTSDPNSFWKIKLINSSGEEVGPIAIEQLTKTPYYYAMLDYLDRWSRLFRITFPKIDLGDEVTLEIYSIIGESKMDWKLSKKSKE